MIIWNSIRQARNNGLAWWEREDDREWREYHRALKEQECERCERAEHGGGSATLERHEKDGGEEGRMALPPLPTLWVVLVCFESPISGHWRPPYRSVKETMWMDVARLWSPAQLRWSHYCLIGWWITRWIKLFNLPHIGVAKIGDRTY